MAGLGYLVHNKKQYSLLIFWPVYFYTLNLEPGG